MPELAGTVALLVTLGLLGGLLWLFWQGPPYLPSKDATIAEMIELAGIRSGTRIRRGTRVAELGCGDGRLAIALARAGAQVDGYEINPLLVWRARRNVRRAGVGDRVTIYRRNFWNVDCAPYRVVTIFGIPHIMEKLGRKLAAELPRGAHVVSNAFPIPGLPKDKQTARAFSYIIGPKP